MGWFTGKKRWRQLEQENAQLRQDNARLQLQLIQLQDEIAGLVKQLAAARKHSGNSSKPPSSDIVKPKGQGRRQKSRRRIGGQKGHPKHQRPAFAPKQVDQRVGFHLKQCPVDPSHRIRPAEGSQHQRTIQQVELVEKPFRVTEYTAYSIWCQDCQCYHQAQLPEPVRRAGLFGPRLTSLVVYLKGKIHASYSGIAEFCQDVVGLKVSRGYVAKLLQKASQAFAQPYDQLLQLLPQQTRLNTDETGHKDNGQRHWTWCFRAARFVVFTIDPSRGSEVLTRILGQDFKGILGCDYFSAYRKYTRQCSVLVQFCLAHLIRDVKYLCEFPEARVQSYGRQLLGGLQGLFGTLHRKEQLSARTFQAHLRQVQGQIWKAAIPCSGAPHHRLIYNMAERFYLHGDAYFQFITTPGIQPTNNVAEQAMRFVVIDRHITQGTRSVRGQQICERLWTVMATCSLHKRSAFQWIHQAIGAYFKGAKAPSLIPDSS